MTLFLQLQGHLIKNPSTQRAKSLLDIPCSHRIIVSGTPLQNNLKVLSGFLEGSHFMFFSPCFSPITLYIQNKPTHNLYTFCAADFQNRSCGPYLTSVALSYWVIRYGKNLLHDLFFFGFKCCFFMKLWMLFRFKERFESRICRGNEKNASDREKRIGSTAAQVMTSSIL